MLQKDAHYEEYIMNKRDCRNVSPFSCWNIVMDINNMDFNTILIDNIETPTNITFSTPSQVFSNSTEKHSPKNGEHGDSHILKIEKYIKDK